MLIFSSGGANNRIDHSYRLYQSLTPSFCFPVDLSISAAEAWTLDFLLSPVALGETCVALCGLGEGISWPSCLSWGPSPWLHLGLRGPYSPHLGSYIPFSPHLDWEGPSLSLLLSWGSSPWLHCLLRAIMADVSLGWIFLLFGETNLKLPVAPLA